MRKRGQQSLLMCCWSNSLNTTTRTRRTGVLHFHSITARILSNSMSKHRPLNTAHIKDMSRAWVYMARRNLMRSNTSPCIGDHHRHTVLRTPHPHMPKISFGKNFAQENRTVDAPENSVKWPNGRLCDKRVAPFVLVLKSLPFRSKSRRPQVW